MISLLNKFVKKLDPNKAHGHDNVSVRMLKYMDSINKPLATIFKNCFNETVFPKDWKKANVVPIYKKLIS